MLEKYKETHTLIVVRRETVKNLKHIMHRYELDSMGEAIDRMLSKEIGSRVEA